MKQKRLVLSVIGEIIMKKGFSVIEILVVVGVFSILGILATQSITMSLKSSKKSDSIVDIKQDLSNATGNLERMLQTADSVIMGVDCVTTNATASVGFRDFQGSRGDIACIDTTAGFYTLNNDKRIASSSGENINYNQRLTSSKMDLTSCSFNCFTQNTQTFIEFSVTGQIKGTSLLEGASYTATKKILIRSSTRK